MLASGHGLTVLHMDAEQTYLPVQDPNKVKPVKISIAEEGGALDASPLVEELMKTDSCQAGMGGSLFFCGVNTSRFFMPHWLTPHP